MKLLMKKSHCFAFAVFAGAAGGMATIQVLRAMKDVITLLAKGLYI